MREVVPHSYLYRYVSAAHGPFSQNLKVMQRRKDNQASSAVKGAETDLNTEILFTTEQKVNYQVHADNVSGETEDDLMHFPPYTVHVCERRQRPLAPLLQQLDNMTAEYSAKEAHMLLNSMLIDMMSAGYDQSTGFNTISNRAFSFWLNLSEISATAYDLEDDIVDSLSLEYVPVVCLR